MSGAKRLQQLEDEGKEQVTNEDLANKGIAENDPNKDIV